MRSLKIILRKLRETDVASRLPDGFILVRKIVILILSTQQETIVRPSVYLHIKQDPQKSMLCPPPGSHGFLATALRSYWPGPRRLGGELAEGANIHVLTRRPHFTKHNCTRTGIYQPITTRIREDEDMGTTDKHECRTDLLEESVDISLHLQNKQVHIT